MSKFRKILSLPLHPIFITTYTGLSLYVNNIDFIPFKETIQFFTAAVFLTIVGIALFTPILKGIQKAALFCSLLSILFFSYSEVYAVLSGPLQRHSYLLISIAGALLIGFIAIVRLSDTRTNTLNSFLNLSSGVIFIFQLSQLLVYNLPKDAASPIVQNTPSTNKELSNLPDIYYIILDGYGRSDVLKKNYGLDNSDFVDFLSSSGFYVSGSSTSNYCRTIVSIPSSLNFDYIQHLIAKPADASAAYQQMSSLIKHAQIFTFLKKHGYQIHTFQSGYSAIDEGINNESSVFQETDSDFNYLIASKTPLTLIEENPLLYRLFSKIRLKVYSNPFDKHRQRILTVLKQLPDVAQADKPNFVFADILAAHPPFVFDEKGRPVEAKRTYSLIDGDTYMASRGASKEEYIKGYNAQLKYVNKLLQTTIERVLEKSHRPVVFILQGDHGPGANFDENEIQKTELSERFAILNAIYFSDGDTTLLQPNHTPINTFRIVLNKYFGQNLPLLENQSYYSPLNSINDFTDVTHQLREAK